MARIFVFDDDREMCESLQEVLQEAGHAVQSATDGESGMALFREEPSEIVITDIRMPEKSGNDTILELRAEYPLVKIIAMSGGGAVGPDVYMKVARKLGADIALSKPFLPGELLSAVHSLV